MKNVAVKMLTDYSTDLVIVVMVALKISRILLAFLVIAKIAQTVNKIFIKVFICITGY